MDIRGFFGAKKPAASKPEIDNKPKADVIQENKSPNCIGAMASPIKSNGKADAAVELPKDIASPEISATVNSVIPKDIEEMITWKAGESVPYKALVDTFDQIERISGRIEKENLFAKLFKAVILTTPKDLEAIVYLASNNVYPAYEGMELGIGDSLLIKAVCEATGRKKDAVEEAYKREGDLGIYNISNLTIYE